MKKWLVCCGILLLSACVSQPLTPQQLAEQVDLVQSPPMLLQKNPDVEKVVSYFVKKQGKQYTSLETALQTNLQQQGFKITSSPSLAGYVVLASVVHMGSVSRQQAQKASQQSYGSAWQGQGIVDTTQEMGLAVVLDVHVAMRKKAKRVRNNSHVVSSASLDTVVDEEKTRMVAFMPTEEDLTDAIRMAEFEKILLQRVAKGIAKAL